MKRTSTSSSCSKALRPDVNEILPSSDFEFLTWIGNRYSSGQYNIASQQYLLPCIFRS